MKKKSTPLKERENMGRNRIDAALFPSSSTRKKIVTDDLQDWMIQTFTLNTHIYSLMKLKG